MEEKLYDFLEDWTDRFVEAYKDELGESRLADSVTSEVTVDGDNYSITLDLNHYWYYVENGRAAGRMPPLDAMLSYADKIIPRPFKLKTGRQIIPTKKQLAYMLQNHIGAKGTKPHNYMRIVARDMNQELVDGVRKILSEQINDIIK